MVALNQRGVNPLDPRPTPRRIHRTGATQQQDRHPIAPGIEDGHARVLQADHVVQRSDHRPTGGLGVAVRQGDRDLLVAAQDRARALVAAVIDQGIVQPAEARARIEGGILDTQRVQQIDHQVGAVFRCPRHGRVSRTAWTIQDHAGTGTLRSKGMTRSAYRSRNRR